VIEAARRYSPEETWVGIGLAIVVVPTIIAYAVVMIRRPEDAYRSYRFWSEQPPSRFDFAWVRGFGWVVLAFMCFWVGAAILEILTEISNSAPADTRRLVARVLDRA
jgi:hypothetical protein